MESGLSFPSKHIYIIVEYVDVGKYCCRFLLAHLVERVSQRKRTLENIPVLVKMAVGHQLKKDSGKKVLLNAYYVK